MNVTARALVLVRLCQCRDTAGLRTVWQSLGRDAQADEQVQAVKEQLKKQFQEAGI